MYRWHGAAQVILQILSNPAWGGISVIVSSVLSIIVIFRARQSKPSRPQETQNLHIPPGEIRHFIRGSYRRATVAKEFVNDVDILVVVDPKKLTL